MGCGECGCGILVDAEYVITLIMPLPLPLKILAIIDILCLGVLLVETTVAIILGVYGEENHPELLLIDWATFVIELTVEAVLITFHYIILWVGEPYYYKVTFDEERYEWKVVPTEPPMSIRVAVLINAPCVAFLLLLTLWYASLALHEPLKAEEFPCVCSPTRFSTSQHFSRS